MAKPKRTPIVSSKHVYAPEPVSFKNKIVNNFGLLSYLFIILFVGSLFISSLCIGGITWDEVYGIPMIQTHFAAAFNNIPLSDSSNRGLLIYYGMIHLLPGYILSLVFDNYHTCSHITIFMMSLLASFYVYKIARLAGMKHNVAYITAAFLLLYPIWLGHSFFNDKDIPAAVFFTIYSYYVCRVLNVTFLGNRASKSLCFKLILIGALLAGTKFAFFPIIIINSILIMFFYKVPNLSSTALTKDSSHNKNKLSFLRDKVVPKLLFGTIIIGLTLLLTIIFTPGSWHEPVTYIINDILLMGKFAWTGCTHLLGQCIYTNSLEWSTARYLLSWYWVQMPLFFMLLFTLGVVSVVLVFLSSKRCVKHIWMILLVQLLFIPILAIIRNSTLYDATRHTLFCVPIIILICGLGLEFINTIVLKKYARNIVVGLFGLLFLCMIIDVMLLNPYQYAYFNEFSRFYINDKNTDTDYWGFSLRETYEKIDQMQYYTPYISMENGPLPETLTPFMSGNYQFVHYEKNMQVPANISINVIGLVRGGFIEDKINPDRCKLISETSRALLFKSDRFSMSKVYRCN